MNKAEVKWGNKVSDVGVLKNERLKQSGVFQSSSLSQCHHTDHIVLGRFVLYCFTISCCSLSQPQVKQNTKQIGECQLWVKHQPEYIWQGEAYSIIHLLNTAHLHVQAHTLFLPPVTKVCVFHCMQRFTDWKGTHLWNHPECMKHVPASMPEKESICSQRRLETFSVFIIWYS